MSHTGDTGSAIRDTFHTFLLEMAGRFEPYPFLRRQEQEIRQLAESVLRPFTLAVFGRMKTGKSSLINALVGRHLAITGVEEATATVNWISHGDGLNESTMLVHWKDGSVEPLPLDRITEWTGKAGEVLERVRKTAFLQLFANIDRLKGMEIVDTPGTGAAVDEHEEVARSFLSPRAAEDSVVEGRKADALLYVFPPVARETDQSTLDEYRNTRMPGSDPYNSIGVLHKWDAMESKDLMAEAECKAARLCDCLAGMVSEVIPVSAPLAMVARNAPDSYVEALLDLTMKPGAADQLLKALSRDTRWREDDNRSSVYSAYPAPWASFRRIVRLLLDHSCSGVADARAVCLEASGIQRLENELDARFFRRAALIKQRLVRVKAKEPISSGLRALNTRLDELANDHRHFIGLAKMLGNDGDHGVWLQTKSQAIRHDQQSLEEYAVEADRMWLVEQDRMERMERDLAFLEMVKNDPDLIEARDNECIHRLLGSQGVENGDVPLQILDAMLKRYAHQLDSPSKTVRTNFEHLVERLQISICSLSQGPNTNTTVT
jgi:hypothetical protein